jgi:hypothetical protein
VSEHRTGQRVRFVQVSHIVSYQMKPGGIPVHYEAPATGTGTVHIAFRQGAEEKVWILADADKGKLEKYLTFCRCPPDSVEVLGVRHD